MRTRTVLTATVVAVLPAAIAMIPLAGVAYAAPTDRICPDFANQAAAQAALRSHTGDPARLDPDHNGVACESYFGTARPDAAADDAAPNGVAPDDAGVGDPAPGDVAPVDPAADAPDPATDPADETSVKTGAPADAAVRTVPQRQILVHPRGAADTGDGSTTTPDGTPVALLAAGLGAAAVLGGGYRPTRRQR